MQSTLKIVSIFICLILALSPLAFASDLPSDSEQEPLEVEDAPYYAVDLDHQRIMESAIELKAATATEYTTTDLYNLLYAALRGRSSSSSYSLVAMNYDLRSLTQSVQGFLAPSIGADPLHAIQDIHSILSGTALGLNPIATIADCLHLEAGDQSYSISDLTGMIWSLVQDIESDTSVSNSLLSSINSNLTSVGSLDWQPARSFVSMGFTSDFESFSTSAGYYGDQYYYAFTVGLYSDNVIFRLSIPVNTRQVYQFTDWDIIIGRFYNDQFIDFDNVYLGYDYTYRTLYIYFIPLQTNQNTYVHLSNDQVYLWGSSFGCDVLSIDDVQSYEFYNNLLIRSGFNSLDSIYGGVERLADYFVSPEKQSAESASQEVIDETLDGFTGNGAAAAKASDSSSMKNISSSVRSGLDSGASVSDATNVFSSSGAFWSWFTESCSNQINLPYPAPVVEPTRGSGDEIVDYLTPNNNELQSLLLQGGDQR